MAKNSGSRGGGSRAPRAVVRTVKKPKDVCIGTNCDKPQKKPNVPHPGYRPPKRVPKSRKI